MIGTRYVTYNAEISTKTVGYEDAKVYDSNTFTVNRSDLIIDKATEIPQRTLAPGAYFTVSLPDEPCIIQMQSHRHATDGDNLITDAMPVEVSGCITGTFSEIGHCRVEGDTAAGLTIKNPDSATDSVTVIVRAWGIDV